MYLGLVWIGCFDIYRVSKFAAPKLILLVCGAIVWGGLMELLQGAMSMGRSADWYDFLANSCGAIRVEVLVILVVHLHLAIEENYCFQLQSERAYKDGSVRVYF